MLGRTQARATAAVGGAAILTAAVMATANSIGGVADEGGQAGSAAAQTRGQAGHHDKIEKVALRGVHGNKVGWVLLRQTGRVVVVRGWVRSMSPGFHGFHIHTTGLCEADAPAGPFTTAGGHYTGGDTTHGDHAGDLPSLLVTEAGRAFSQFVTDRFTLADLRDADGSAVMVHAGTDNFANIPERYSSGGVPGPDATTLATGDAGARVACGVIW
jgi:superoxide dismutase, Cu-Zn family